MSLEDCSNVWEVCSECSNQPRNHRVLFEKRRETYDAERQDGTRITHLLIQCMGCDAVRYRRSALWIGADADFYGAEEYDIQLFPACARRPHSRLQLQFDENGESSKLVPQLVRKMYAETIAAIDAGAHTLAGGGLRAIVEAICLSLKVEGKSLHARIDELHRMEHLTKAQADLLHEERYLGNSALHEMETPSSEDIEDGLQIVEGLINAIYILPQKAEKLKNRRNARKASPESTAATDNNESKSKGSR